MRKDIKYSAGIAERKNQKQKPILHLEFYFFAFSYFIIMAIFVLDNNKIQVIFKNVLMIRN